MQYISTSTAGKILSVSDETVRRFIKQGKLKNYNKPSAKALLLDIDEVMALNDIKNGKRDWFSRKEACQFLGISQAMLSYYAKVYELPFEKEPYGLQRVRFKKSDILNLKKYLV